MFSFPSSLQSQKQGCTSCFSHIFILNILSWPMKTNVTDESFWSLTFEWVAGAFAIRLMVLLAGCTDEILLMPHPVAFNTLMSLWMEESHVFRVPPLKGREEYGEREEELSLAVFLSFSESARFELSYVWSMKDYVVLQLFSTKPFSTKWGDLIELINDTFSILLSVFCV